MKTPESLNCPLCRSSSVARAYRVRSRIYHECGECRLVRLSPEHRLDPAAERVHYGTHENDPADPRYRAFLSRLVDPLVARLSPGSRGLDYGSGPAPTLSVMLEEKGFDMTDYDPFFAPSTESLDTEYDFITCSETAEHFFRPGDEFSRLGGLLRPGGWLGVMTELLSEDRIFEEWRYARDPTHVAFYRQSTIEHIAHRNGWSVEMPHPNVALFHKPRPPHP